MAGGISYTALYTGTYFLLMTAIAAWQSAEISRPGTLITIIFWAVFYGLGLLCGRRYRQSPSPVDSGRTELHPLKAP